MPSSFIIVEHGRGPSSGGRRIFPGGDDSTLLRAMNTKKALEHDDDYKDSDFVIYQRVEPLPDLPTGRAIQFRDLIGGKVVDADKEEIVVDYMGDRFLISSEIRASGQTARSHLVWSDRGST